MLDILKAARDALFHGATKDNRSAGDQGDAEQATDFTDNDDSIINQLAAIEISDQQSAAQKNPSSPRRYAAAASRKRNCNCIGKRK